MEVLFFYSEECVPEYLGLFGSGIFMMAGGGGVTKDGVRGLIARWGSNAFTIMRWRGRLYLCVSIWQRHQPLCIRPYLPTGGPGIR